MRISDWSSDVCSSDLTGARSAGLVSQGKIGSIVQAKPIERRALLEEAANIRGLHTRRHEAELRLKAAEQNLERLDDVLKALEGQRQALRRRSEEHTSELQSLMRISYAVFCLQKKKNTQTQYTQL